MRKIMILVIATIMILTLSACGSSPTVVDAIVSVNRNVISEPIAGLAGRISNLEEEQDIELYLLMSNATIQRVAPQIDAQVITAGQQYRLTIRAENITGVEWPIVYVWTQEAIYSGQTPTPYLSFTRGIEGRVNSEQAVFETVAPLLANNINKTNITLTTVVADPITGGVRNHIVLNDELNINVQNFDIYGPRGLGSGSVGMNSEIIVSVENNPNIVRTFQSYTHRPSNNNDLPIQTRTATWFWDYILIIPIAWLMSIFSRMINNSFAWGIIFATIIIRALAWPIYAKTNDSSLKMQLAQPELQKIQNKYATRKDPASKQKMQMETMAVYKKHGINVLGCLTPLLQMPIFIAMFQVVHRIVVPGGMFADHVVNTYFFFGLIDLTHGGWTSITSIILSSIVGVSMFFLNRMSTKKPDYLKNTGTQVKSSQAVQTEKTMKIVMYVMIIFMVFASIQSNALALYWIVGNIFSLIQTYVNRRLSAKKYHKKKNSLIINTDDKKRA